jgi:hypothetical protein
MKLSPGLDEARLQRVISHFGRGKEGGKLSKTATYYVVLLVGSQVLSCEPGSLSFRPGPTGKNNVLPDWARLDMRRTLSATVRSNWVLTQSFVNMGTAPTHFCARC